MANSDWLSPAEAGAILGVGPDRLAQLAREGALTSMHTPGGHVRVRRDEVEAMADPDGTPSPDERPSKPVTPREPAPPPRPKWEDVPPWQRRVREAEADVHVLALDDQREGLLEARTKREAERDQVEARRAARAVEEERLRELKTFALSCLPDNIPDDVKAGIARDLEEDVTTADYPAALARAHVEALLKGEVDRMLRPWRAREARRAQATQDAATRESLITWAALHVTVRAPRGWDWDTKREFERELRLVLADEIEPGMDQDEANAIGMDFLEEWLEDNDDS